MQEGLLCENSLRRGRTMRCDWVADHVQAQARWAERLKTMRLKCKRGTWEASSNEQDAGVLSKCAHDLLRIDRMVRICVIIPINTELIGYYVLGGRSLV